MRIQVMSFGQIAEITGAGKLLLDAEDTHALRLLLEQKFPGLQNKKYAIAVNRRLITQDVPLTENAEVALLPPFSGG